MAHTACRNVALALVTLVLTACGIGTPGITTATLAPSTPLPTLEPAATPTGTETPGLDLDALPHGVWSEISRMPFPASEISGALLDGRFYVAGGLLAGVVTTDNLQVYDVARNEWSLMSEMPRGRNHHVTAALDGRIYFLEGAETLMPPPYSRYRAGYIYDVASDTWSGTSRAPANRMGASAVAINGWIYILGGALYDPSAEGEQAARSVQRYDPAEDTWTELTPAPMELEHAVAAVLDGMIYLTGGRTPEPHATVYRYDPTLDAWGEISPMLEPRSAHAAMVLDGRLYVCGGERFLPETGAETLSSVEIYDPATGEWTFGPELPAGIHGLTGFVYQGALFLVGGSDTPNDVDNVGRVLVLRP